MNNLFSLCYTLVCDNSSNLYKHSLKAETRGEHMQYVYVCLFNSKKIDILPSDLEKGDNRPQAENSEHDLRQRMNRNMHIKY